MKSLQIDQKSIQTAIRKITEEYSHISGDVLNQAVSRALNRAAAQGRTAANKEIRQVYNISASKVNSEIKINYSTARSMTTAIRASGEPLSFNNFQAKEIKPQGTTSFSRRGVASSRITRKAKSNAEKGVTAIIKKGESINLPTAFIQVANGGITVFARGKYKSKGEGFEFGDDRMPIGKMTTVSIPLMMANAEVLTPLGKSIEGFFSKRIDHEINYLLSK